MISESTSQRSAPPAARGRGLLWAGFVLLASLACSPSAGAREEIAASADPLELSSSPSRLQMPLSAGARARLLQALSQAGPGAVAVRFEGVRTVSQPGCYYEIYLDLPERAPGGAAAAHAFGPESPHYVGNLSLFGLGTEPGGATQDLPLAPTVRRLRERGLWQDSEVSLTLVPRGEPGSARIERVALTVE
jgi:hypothetical protein